MTVGYGGELAFGSTEEKTEGAERGKNRDTEREEKERLLGFFCRGDPTWKPALATYN